MSDNFNQNNGLLNESKNKQNETVIKNNFLDKVVEFFTGFTSDERIKLRKLKDISKDLKRLKYKFYSFKDDMILAPLPGYFYDMFRMSQNFLRFLDAKNHSASIKLMIFDLFSTDNQKKIKDELNPEKINDFVKNSKDKPQSIEKIKNKLNEYVKSFTTDIINKINSTYNQIVDFSNLITFDWFFLLHKFDAEITETNFTYNPNFEAIEGKYILDELVTLNDYIETIDFQKDFKNITEYIKIVSNDEGLVKLFNKFIQLCLVLKRDKYLNYIIKLIYKDPFFEHKKFSSNAKIVQDFIYNFQVEIKKSVDKVISEIKRENINNLLMEIFSKITVVRLKNYNERKNELLNKKGVSGFKYIDPLNYLKAFLLDFCKGEIKPRIDAVLIKGTWSTNIASNEYSELLIKFNKLAENLLEFDNLCSEEEYYGKSIRQISFAAGHDPNAKNLLTKAVYKIDAEALKIINDGIKLFTFTSIKIKELIDDFNEKTPKIIIDFHKIPWDFPSKVNEELGEIYKKIQKFIVLLKFYIKEATQEALTPGKEPAQK